MKLMKLKTEVKLWNYYPHTYQEGGIRLTLHPGQLLMDAKVVSGTTKCQKDIVSENKTCLDNINLHGVLLAM